MQVFGEKLKELRVNKKMTQEEFGKIFKEPKSQSTIGTWERGDREPPMDEIIQVAQYFNVSIDYLFGMEEDRRTISVYKIENNNNPNDIIEFLEKENIEYNDLKLRKNEKELIKRVIDAIFYQS